MKRRIWLPPSFIKFKHAYTQITLGAIVCCTHTFKVFFPVSTLWQPPTVFIKPIYTVYIPVVANQQSKWCATPYHKIYSSLDIEVFAGNKMAWLTSNVTQAQLALGLVICWIFHVPPWMLNVSARSFRGQWLKMVFQVLGKYFYGVI